MKIWYVVISSVLILAMLSFSSCELLGFGDKEKKAREAEQERLEFEQRVKEAAEKAMEEYSQQLKESLEQYLKEYQEYQQKMLEQQLQQAQNTTSGNQTQAP